ncbi:c-type cytochrome [Aestuariirhabdus litorea]|uniref:Cytochrome c n=1 Tax=Aestuariirhabdus litorea TaxID=2528527 RepID=A0A3P3VPI0_9GAMM|nr:cytochrome c [Aestuariirhabdus litorea]RRJ82723.1 cytochrome c [Aestuariirhabdus litorea]RWW92883.1 cytochrome c [Endozoicomonadaceae bacterium GTF-13]
MKLRPLVLGLCASTLLMSPVALQAAENNPNIVHRQGIMKIVGGHMGALKSILVLGFDAPQDVSYHAQGMMDALSHMGNSFPPGSDKGETKARKEIWEDMDTFKQRGKDLRMALEALNASANDKGAALDAFKKVGKACKSCHDDFRKKD